MISKAIKLKVIEALREREQIEGNRQRVCSKYDLRPDILSRMLTHNETEKVLSPQRWIRLARSLEIPLENETENQTARTETFNHIWSQLEFAQQFSVSGMLCDRADIGKTHTAKLYAREVKNAVYVDCSQNKTPFQLVRAIAKGFGLDNTGNIRMVRADLYDWIKTINKPLVILDEFGDLSNSAHLEFKALWNATDQLCGYYAMGAGGLRNKVENNIAKNIIGYEEIFSRLGNKFQRITPPDEEGFKEFQTRQMVQIGKANGVKDIQAMIARSNLSLRRIPIQKGIENLNKKNNNN